MKRLFVGIGVLCLECSTVGLSAPWQSITVVSPTSLQRQRIAVQESYNTWVVADRQAAKNLDQLGATADIEIQRARLAARDMASAQEKYYSELTRRVDEQVRRLSAQPPSPLFASDEATRPPILEQIRELAEEEAALKGQIDSLPAGANAPRRAELELQFRSIHTLREAIGAEVHENDGLSTTKVSASESRQHSLEILEKVGTLLRSHAQSSSISARTWEQYYAALSDELRVQRTSKPAVPIRK